MGGPALVAAEPYLIKQDYEHYTPEQHAVWTELVRRRLPQVEEYACQEYLEGLEIIGLRKDRHAESGLHQRDGCGHGQAGTPRRERLPSGRCVF